MRAWLDTAGALPCNVKVLVEGEEEIGSPGLAPLPRRARRRAARPTCCSSPTPATGRSARPGLTYSLRGLAGVDVRVRALDGPGAQRHGRRRGPRSGARAGAACSPSLVDEHGDPAFDGCWDDYEAPDAAERARLAALPVDVDGLRRAWGVRAGVELAGDPRPSTCSSGCGCARRSPSSASTAIRSRDRRTRSSPRPRRASACASGAVRIRRASTTRCAAHLERARAARVSS